MRADIKEMIEEKGAVFQLQAHATSSSELDSFLMVSGFKEFNLATLLPVPPDLQDVSLFGLAFYLAMGRKWDHAAEVLESIGEDEQLTAALKNPATQMKAITQLQALSGATEGMITIRKNLSTHNALSASDWVAKNRGAFSHRIEVEAFERISPCAARILCSQPQLDSTWLAPLCERFTTIHFVVTAANASLQVAQCAHRASAHFRFEQEAIDGSSSLWVSTPPAWLAPY